MSEVIVRMEMPKDCYDCPMYDFAVYRGKSTLCCNAHFDLKPIPNNGNSRPSWCPIIGELPEQHGRLIDASTVIGAVQDEEDNDVPVTVDDYLGLQIPVPTIVPATERSET